MWYPADASMTSKFDNNGTFLTAWGGNGGGDGAFWYPNGVAVTPSGHILVTDTNNDRIEEFDANGTFLTSFGHYGTALGEFEGPRHLATDASGDVFLADEGVGRIQKFACP